MYGPISALLWERWRQIRWAAIPVFAIPLATGILCALAITPETDSFDEDMITGSYAAFAFLGGLAWVLLLLTRLGALSSDTQETRLSFPAQAYRLPLRTWKLVAVHLAFAGTAFFSYVLLAIVGAKMLDSSYSVDVIFDGAPGAFSVVLWDAFILALGITALFLIGQAAAWLLGPMHTFAGLSGALGAGAGIPFVLLLWLARMGDQITLTSIARLYLPSLALCAAAYGMAVAAVALDRRGFWHAPFRGFRRITSALPARNRPFSGPLQAQLWFETRHRGWSLPLMAGLGAPLALLYILAIGDVYDTDSWLAATARSAFDYGIPTAYGFCIIAGLWRLLAWQRDLKSGMARFIYCRPVPTRTLALARLLSWALPVLAIALAITGLAWLAAEMSEWGLAIQEIPALGGFRSAELSNTAMVSIWLLAALAIVWLLYACNGPVVIGGILWIMTMLAIMNTGDMWTEEERYARFLTYALPIVIGASVAVLLALSAAAIHLKALKKRDLALPVILFAGTAAAATWIYTCINMGWDLETPFPLPLATALLTAAGVALPLVAVPVTMEVQRHRRA